MSDARAARQSRSQLPTVVGRSVLLRRSQLLVHLREDRGLVFLEARSRVEPAQWYLLSLVHRPVLAGLTSITRLGAMHALCWGLAFGVGPVPEDAMVRFESGTLRHATTVDSAVQRLTDDCWVADARGVLTRATLLAGDRDDVRVRLAEQP